MLYLRKKIKLMFFWARLARFSRRIWWKNAFVREEKKSQRGVDSSQGRRQTAGSPCTVPGAGPGVELQGQERGNYVE